MCQRPRVMGAGELASELSCKNARSCFWHACCAPYCADTRLHAVLQSKAARLQPVQGCIWSCTKTAVIGVRVCSLWIEWSI